MLGSSAFSEVPFSATPAVAAGPVTHATTGALTGPGSAVAGSSARFRAFATSGALTGPGSTVAGSAARTRAHDAAGVLAGPGAIIVGSAARVAGAVTHATTGVLTGPGAEVVGVANYIALYPDPSDVRAGVQYGPGGIYIGTLSVEPAELAISLRSFGGRF